MIRKTILISGSLFMLLMAENKAITAPSDLAIDYIKKQIDGFSQIHGVCHKTALSFIGTEGYSSFKEKKNSCVDSYISSLEDFQSTKCIPGCIDYLQKKRFGEDEALKICTHKCNE